MTIPAYNEILRRSFHSPLTPLGERQAQAVAQRLAGAPIDRLYSSPFARALATARVIGATLSLEPQVIDDLREVLPLPLNELKDQQRARPLRQLFIRSYLKMIWPRGANSWAANYRRAKAAWAQITAESARGVAAVAHRGTIALILFSLRNDRRWQVIGRDTSNCGVSIVVSRR